MPRPDRLAVVCGTATDVGKTWVSCRLLEALRGQGVAVAACKPAQSFDPGDAAATDAELLAAASGRQPHDVCPPHRWYPVAMAPPMAAQSLARPAFTCADLAGELRWPPGTAAGIIETAGGVASPLAADGDSVTLCELTGPDQVILVADAGLGTISAVRLCAGALRRLPAPVVVYLNRCDPGSELHRRNRDWLARRDQLDVVTSVSALAERLI